MLMKFLPQIIENETKVETEMQTLFSLQNFKSKQNCIYEMCV